MEKGYGMGNIEGVIAEVTGEKPMETRKTLLQRERDIGGKL